MSIFSNKCLAYLQQFKSISFIPREKGCRFTVLARSLVEVLGANEVAGEVYCLSAQVCLYREPALATNELLFLGERKSISAGDALFASLNRSCYDLGLFWGGSNLATVSKAVAETCLFMKAQKQLLCLFFTLILQRTILRLQGGHEAKIADLSREIQSGKIKQIAEAE